MTLAAEIGLWAFRAVGVLYLLGGLFGVRQFWIWGRLESGMAKLERSMGAGDGAMADEARRSFWLLAGSVLTALSGAAMAAASRIAVALLAALIVHQLLYFLRQRARVRRAATPEAAADAAPAKATINAFYGVLFVTVAGAALAAIGALR